MDQTPQSHTPNELDAVMAPDIAQQLDAASAFRSYADELTIPVDDAEPPLEKARESDGEGRGDAEAHHIMKPTPGDGFYNAIHGLADDTTPNEAALENAQRSVGLATIAAVETLDRRDASDQVQPAPEPQGRDFGEYEAQRPDYQRLSQSGRGDSELDAVMAPDPGREIGDAAREVTDRELHAAMAPDIAEQQRANAPQGRSRPQGLGL